MGLPAICFGCEVAGDANLAATVLSIVGAFTGIAGAVTAYSALKANQKNHDAQILREEFIRHRVPLEGALQQIKQALVTLRGSARPVLPIATVDRNFSQAWPLARAALETVLVNCEEIDKKALFSKPWLPALSSLVDSVDEAKELVSTTVEVDQVRKQAAASVVANLDAFVALLDSNIDSAIRTPLTKRSWTK